MHRRLYYRSSGGGGRSNIIDMHLSNCTATYTWPALLLSPLPAASPTVTAAIDNNNDTCRYRYNGNNNNNIVVIFFVASECRMQRRNHSNARARMKIQAAVVYVRRLAHG